MSSSTRHSGSESSSTSTESTLTQSTLEFIEENASSSLISPASTHIPRMIKLHYENWTLRVPDTITEAHELLHMLRSHRRSCVAQKTAAEQRLHTMIICVNFLRTEIDREAERIKEADSDIGQARQMISLKGLPDIFSCSECIA
ncbi:hypothetical protein MIND_01127100 [Mycena indigotica]|uniref:Uncharacterized protein n=1 Tax=Mycena indigotica TaxID=2126181 RepID=A0A8H6VTM2_9AGAR|nr:uncharacterized protein MIND_01127100 [Mycena indigotica]KAF7293492.1 hypothetical protein MIND_01127100 [Mycena indigotica]